MRRGESAESAGTSAEGSDDRTVNKSFLLSAYTTIHDVEKDGSPEYLPRGIGSAM